MRRGYDDAFDIGPAKIYRFNEAEAHAPRILRRRCASGPVRSGFNEAEAHAPRIPIPNRPVEIYPALLQ